MKGTMYVKFDDLVLLQDECVLRSGKVTLSSGTIDDLEQSRKSGGHILDAVDNPDLRDGMYELK